MPSRVKPIFVVLVSSLLLATWLGSAHRARAADDAGKAAEFDTLLTTWIQAKTLGDPKLIAGFLSDEFIGVGPAGRGEDKRAFVQRVADPKIVVQDIHGHDQST